MFLIKNNKLWQLNDVVMETFKKLPLIIFICGALLFLIKNLKHNS